MMKKRMIASCLALVFAIAVFVGCGKDAQASKLEGSCEEILTKVYENAKLDDELREAMKYYQTTPIDETTAEYLLGTADVKYAEAVVSAPMMNAIASQCVILRVAEGEDVEAAKKLLMDNANPRKWVCVEAESVVVENVGDVILYIMADQTTADAVKTSFLALGE